MLSDEMEYKMCVYGIKIKRIINSIFNEGNKSKLNVIKKKINVKKINGASLKFNGDA